MHTTGGSLHTQQTFSFLLKRTGTCLASTCGGVDSLSNAETFYVVAISAACSSAPSGIILGFRFRDGLLLIISSSRRSRTNLIFSRCVVAWGHGYHLYSSSNVEKWVAMQFTPLGLAMTYSPFCHLHPTDLYPCHFNENVTYCDFLKCNFFTNKKINSHRVF